MPVPESVKSCLIIVDFQKQFCNTFNSSELKLLLNNIKAVLSFFRSQDAGIIYTKMVYDRENLPLTALKRLEKFTNSNFLAPSNPDTALFGLEPQALEVIIEKSTYDPFLNKKFLRSVKQFRPKHIYVMGLYLDICIDSVIRGAYQRGVRTTVISDCVKAKHYPFEEVEAFMSQYYDTNFLTSFHLLGGAACV